MKIITLNLRKGKDFAGAIKETVKYIKQGKVVVLPTDTVYGLAADAANKKENQPRFQGTKPKNLFQPR